MENRNLSFAYNANLVSALAAFIDALEIEASVRLTKADFSHGGDDGDIGGLLGVQLLVGLSDDECDDIEQLLTERRRLREVHPDCAIAIKR